MQRVERQQAEGGAKGDERHEVQGPRAHVEDAVCIHPAQDLLHHAPDTGGDASLLFSQYSYSIQKVSIPTTIKYIVKRVN